jgi:acetoin utilization protein AcuB
VADVIRSHGGRIASILSSYMKEDKQLRQVYIRIMEDPSVDLKALKKDLEGRFELLFMIEDDVTIP